MTAATLNVAMKIYGGKNRIMLGIDGRPVDVEDGCRLLFLTAEDFEQGVDLFVRGALVDNRHVGALAFIHGTRPVETTGGPETIQPDIPELPVDNLHRLQPFADIVDRCAVEFTRTSVGTIAGADFLRSGVSNRYKPFYSPQNRGAVRTDIT